MSTTPARKATTSPAKKPAAPNAKPADESPNHPDDTQDDDTLTGYVYVSRTVTTVDDPDDDRAPGYVHIPGEEEPRLVDAKSVPELEVLGYRIVDAPKADDNNNAGKGEKSEDNSKGGG